MSKQVFVCQSCAMPLVKDEDCGTEKDGSRSSIYCTYCYQNGEFTDPDATVEGIAELLCRMISQMYGIPMDKARMFMTGQIQTLKRWSGRIVPNCQSCGMPLFTSADAGTEKDGKESSTYCITCYRNGVFTEPDLTHEGMVQKCTPMLAQMFDLKPEKAEEMVRVFTKDLSRWK
ncbi:zinc ribbon domain-containing protein [Methanospirillum hungatei]|uniref:zinc ribbon domain-containing protein n=1 Tax=Methanospirillum hungatei TaxID=2203 RepID=UPI002CB1BF1D|nr:zinc ribbon domain-containing protein [Methanospirillum hungatei]HOW04057.1 zinc ribbon domain-containing protein [Methanospirillum hungatei]